MTDKSPSSLVEEARRLLGREIEPRIYALVNRGAEICDRYEPRPPLDSVPGCNRCGYSSDAHLLRDLIPVIRALLAAQEAEAKDVEV